MTNAQFKAWRAHLGWTQAEAAEALGVSKPSITLYERGSRSEDNRPVLIPKPVELACAALAMGLRSFAGPEKA